MGLCGVRADMMRSAWGHGAEPMRRACGAFRWECAGGMADTRSVTSVTGVTGKSVGWESEGSVRDFYYYIYYI